MYTTASYNTHTQSAIRMPPLHSLLFMPMLTIAPIPGIIHRRPVTSKTMPGTSDDILTFPYQYCNAIKQVTKC